MISKYNIPLRRLKLRSLPKDRTTKVISENLRQADLLSPGIGINHNLDTDIAPLAIPNIVFSIWKF